MWGVFGFGLIDLETALPPGDPGFREHWFLEGSWGFLVTALVIVPLLVVGLEPARASAPVGQLHVVAACCAAAAVLYLDGTLFALPIALEVTAWAVWMSLRGLAKLVAQGAPTEGQTRQWWPFALVVGTYGGLPLLFGLRFLLERTEDIEVVGESATAAGATTRIPALRPDVAALDARYPDGSGTEVCRAVRLVEPSIKALILTSYNDDEALFAAIKVVHWAADTRTPQSGVLR